MIKLLIVCFGLLLAGCGKGEAVEQVETAVTVGTSLPPASTQPQANEGAQHEPNEETEAEKAQGLTTDDVVAKLKRFWFEVARDEDGNVIALRQSYRKTMTEETENLLKALTDLRELDLSHTPLGENRLAFLERLTELRKLILWAPKPPTRI